MKPKKTSGIVDAALKDAAEIVKPESAPASLVGAPAKPADGKPAPRQPESIDSLTDGAEEPNVSPEEQRQYDTVMTLIQKRTFSADTFPMVLRKLADGQKDIGLAIGHTGAMLLQSVLSSVRMAGKDIPDDVLFAAGQELLADLTEVALGAKMIKPDQKDVVMTRALFEGMKIFGNNMIRSGKVKPEDMGQAKSDLERLGITPEVAAGQSAPDIGRPDNPNLSAPQPPQPPQQPPAPQAGGIVNQQPGV